MDGVEIFVAILIGLACLPIIAWLVMLLVPVAVAGAFTISFVQAIAITLLAALIWGRK